MARSGIRAVGGSGLNDNTSDRDEIIELLRQVSQRLLRSERERLELRVTLEDIAEKTDQGERAYLTIQDRLNKTESLIEKRQKAVEKIQKEQMERIEKAAAMADRIEEVLVQHEKIVRRLDRVMQDKTRMIRKLERIEEAIIETQDAVKSRDLVIAAEQTTSSVAKHGTMIQDVPAQTPAHTFTREEAEDGLLSRRHLAVRITAIAAMVVLGIFGGLSIGAVREGGGFSDFSLEQVTGQTADVAALARIAPEAGDETALIETPDSPEGAADNMLPAEERIASIPEGTQEDILRTGDAQLVARFEENPDALAAQLNDISPSTAADIIDEIHGKPLTGKESVGESARPQAASFTQKTVSEKPKPAVVKKQEAESVSAFLKTQTDPRPLSERIAEDKTLPPTALAMQEKAFNGVAEAQHDLAAIYTVGHAGVRLDYEKASQWFKEAALHGIANAQYNLGVLYHQGMGVPQDTETAIKWYRAAAETGHPEAQYNLAIAYIEGVGMPYDPEKAAYYFEQASGKGIMEAAYNLGLIYENGLTGAGKTDEALYWYKQAADLGSPEAKAAMDQLSKALGLSPEAVEKLYENIKKTKQATSPDSVSPAKDGTGGAVAATQKKAGIEYIQAQPLEPSSTEQSPPPSAGNNVDAGDKSPAVIAQIQEQLIRMGLYPGPADGVMDNLTEDAIRTYQADYDFDADGRPSQALLVHMMTSAPEKSM